MFKVPSCLQVISPEHIPEYLPLQAFASLTLLFTTKANLL